MPEDREKKEKELTKKISEAREKKLIENWRKRKEKKKVKNQQAEAKMKTERKDNLKRKQESWKEQVKNSNRQKVNPPIDAAYEDDEKQPEEEYDDNDSPAVQVENQVEMDNQVVENRDQNEDDLSDFDDIYEPKKQQNSKESQDEHLDNLAQFLDGFDDDELENFL